MANEYIKIGRINMTRAKEAHILAANIFISENQLKHIAEIHKIELEQLGLSAYNYVIFIVNNYNQIRKGANNSLLLIVAGQQIEDVAAIDINYSLKDNFWEVKTAQPRRIKSIKNKTLLWEAAKHTSNGRRYRSN